MTHDEIEERLWEYRDGELPPRESAEVAAHAGSCGRCRSLLEQMGLLSSITKTALDFSCGRGFEDAVLARIKKESRPERVKSRVRAFLDSLAAHPVRKLAAAGALAAALAAFALHHAAQSPAPAYATAAVCEFLASDTQAYTYGGTPALHEAYERYFLSSQNDSTEEP